MNTKIGGMKWKIDKLIEMRDLAKEMRASGSDMEAVKAHVSCHLTWWAPEGITCGEARDMTEWVMKEAWNKQ